MNNLKSKSISKKEKFQRDFIVRVVVILPIITVLASNNVYASSGGGAVNFGSLYDIIFAFTTAIGTFMGIFGLINLIKAFVSNQADEKVTGGMLLMGGIVLAAAKTILAEVGLGV